MARLPAATRASVPPEQAALFDALTAPSGEPPATGPGSVLIHVPLLREYEKKLVNQVRFASTLPQRIIEFATLQAARALDCAYVWSAHVERARKDGVREPVIAALRSGARPAELAPEEQAAWDFAQDYFSTRKVGDAAYQAALAHFGTRGTIELTMVLGCYSMLAAVANTFEVDIPAGRERLPPRAG